MLVTLRSLRVKANRRQYISEKEITSHFTCTFISPFNNQEWSKRIYFYIVLTFLCNGVTKRKENKLDFYQIPRAKSQQNV